jgi:hypothetical protein
VLELGVGSVVGRCAVGPLQGWALEYSELPFSAGESGTAADGDHYVLEVADTDLQQLPKAGQVQLDAVTWFRDGGAVWLAVLCVRPARRDELADGETSYLTLRRCLDAPLAWDPDGEREILGPSVPCPVGDGTSVAELSAWLLTASHTEPVVELIGSSGQDSQLWSVA